MFKPMLASNAKMDQIKFPVMGSLKLEGVRGIFTPFGLKTRPMKEFGNKLLGEKFSIVSDFAKKTGCFVEGEFYIHGMPFNEISSICRRSNHSGVCNITFQIFDIYDPDDPNLHFVSRYERAVREFGMMASKDIIVIYQSMQNTVEEVVNSYSTAIAHGYEGWVLKDPFSPYKLGRSTLKEGFFLRMKEQNTWDGVVIDIVERMENLCESEENELGYLSKRQDKDMKAPTGMAAVAIVKCDDFPGKDIRVTLSKGLSDWDRHEIWSNKEDYIGKHIRWVGIPVKGMLPRSPRFDAWRADLD